MAWNSKLTYSIQENNGTYNVCLIINREYRIHYMCWPTYQQAEKFLNKVRTLCPTYKDFIKHTKGKNTYWLSVTEYLTYVEGKNKIGL